MVKILNPTVQILNLTAKNRGRFGNSRRGFGNRRRGRHFLLTRFSNRWFRWLKFAATQTLLHRGASVGGFGIEPLTFKIARSS
jgi:hypothetical protein